MSKSYEALKPWLDKAMALNTALVLFEWDNETLAPKAAGGLTGNVIEVLSGEYFKAVNDDQVKQLVRECEADPDLTDEECAIVKQLSRELERLEKIPEAEYRAYAKLAAEATRIWSDAKNANDFSMFAPTLKELIRYKKSFARYRLKEGQKLYDVMLDDFEPGFNMELLDRFFETIRQELVPFYKKVMSSPVQIEDGFLTGDFSDETQEKIGKAIAEYEGFDFDKGVFGISAHPFTTNLHNKDVRITTHYNSRLDSSLFSIIHETGHAIYEFGVRDSLTQTLAGQGTSMAMHESQSRFFENILARNKSFWVPIYDKLQAAFPENLGDKDLEEFIRAICKVDAGLIRTEADELTYSLHVLVRYELEKELMEGDLSVDALPEAWADKYEEYLGIRPKTVKEGVLQDIHWAQGGFGYFPSYALGSAFGAQLYAHMKKEMDFEALLENGQISVIREYLREHIHQYGKMKDSRTLIRDTTGEDFDPEYYIQYLKEKYGKLYEIEG